MNRFRNFVFTSFREEKPEMNEDFSYMCAQQEIAPTTGKKHWQGYVECSRKVGIKQLKSMFKDAKIHIEVRKGSQQQAIDYCKKSETAVEGSFFFVGKPKCQGSRSDLDSIVEAMENGATTAEILREFKGNALRHIGMVEKGLNALWHFSKIDEHIHDVRKLARQNKNLPEELIEEMMKPPE